MKFKMRYAEQIVGAFILLAGVGVAVVLIFIGINQRWFARNYYFDSKFASAEGLSVGMAITLKGFEIGKIDTIILTEENRVDVTFHIYDTYYPKVLNNSVLELAGNPLGLGGGLKFHPGKGTGPSLPEFSFIHSLDLKEGQSLVNNGLVALPEGEDMIGSLLGKVDPILGEVQAAIASINSLTTSLDNAINGRGESPVGGILNDLNTTSTKINTVLDETSQQINSLVETTRVRIDSVLSSLDTISADVSKTTATFGDSKGLIKRLLDPSGSLATILDDENALYERIDGSLDSLTGTIQQLRDFVGFINDSRPQITGILEEGSNVLDRGKDVIEAVKNNPLLSGGVPQAQEQPTTFRSYRDEDF